MARPRYPLLSWLVVMVLLAAPQMAQPQGTGSLELRSQEGVELVWEGVSLGTTDNDGYLEVADIPPGTYGVTLRKRGFETARLTLSIRRGKNNLVLELDPLDPPEEQSATPPRPRVVERAEPPPLLRPSPEPKPVSERTVAGEMPRRTGDRPAEGPSGEPSVADEVETPRQLPEGLKDRQEGGQEEEPAAQSPPVPAVTEEVRRESTESETEEPQVESSEQPSGPGLGSLVLLLLVLAGVSLAVWRLRRRAPAKPAVARMPVSREEESEEPSEPLIVEAVDVQHTPTFLEDLKRREEEMEKQVRGGN